MSMMDHPRLAGLFTDDDRQMAAAARIYLSAERLAVFRGRIGALYEPAHWSALGDLKLFSVFAAPEAGGRNLGAAGVALYNDILVDDPFGDVDLALYVQSVVAAMTLSQNRANPRAAEVLDGVVRGRLVLCTAYTDADRDNPVRARLDGDMLVLSGRKWLVVNAPHADFAVATVITGQDRLNCIVDLRAGGVSVEPLARAGVTGSYSQGIVDFQDTVVARANVLSSGIKRLLDWNRIMTISRLLNVVSATHSLAGLIDLATTRLAAKSIGGGRRLADSAHYRAWAASARSTHALLQAGIVGEIAGLTTGARREGPVAGLKAWAMIRCHQLATEAVDMAGGAGVIVDNPIAKIQAAIQCHKFSSGGEFDLLGIYAGSIRTAVTATGGLANAG